MSSLQPGYQIPLPGVKENFNVLHENSQPLMLLNGAFKVLTKLDNSKYPTLAETFSISSFFLHTLKPKWAF